MYKNQNGFSIVEGLLLSVIVILLGFAGWYVWSSDNKPTETTSKENSSGIGNTTSTRKTPSGWISYQNKDLGISFAYPKSWTFEDKSVEPTPTKSHYIGELTSDDKTTTVAVTLVRKKDGRSTHSSIEEWKTYAASSNIQYSNFAEVQSKYISFGYVLDLSGAMGLVYEVLEPNNNIEIVVLPAGTNHKATIEQFVSTLRFEQ